MVRVSTVLAALALAGAGRQVSAHAGDDPGFIRVVNGAFVDEGCNEFLFSGYNTFEIVEAGAEVCCGGKATVDRQFDMAAAQNLTVVRMFAFPVLEGFNLQTSAGKYNEKAAKGLDYVIAAAARRGLKLVVALANNWKYNDKNTDAKCAYTNWTRTAHGCDDFWTDQNAIKLYKKNSEVITGRVNTLTGVAYKDDPTILAWNLINEPRCETPGCAPRMQAWIEDVSAHLKSVDPNHLITVGEDGFYQADNCWSDIANPVPRNGYKNQGAPGSGWPLATGQDFVPNHAPAAIDFLSIHMWPDNWDRTDTDFGKAWIAAHLDNTKLLGKPLVLEEFGKAAGGQWPDQTPAMRDDYYRLVYALAEQSISSSGGLKGIMFWRWAAVDTGSDLGEFDAASMITTESSTFQSVIRPFSARTAERNLYAKKKVAGCKVDARTTPHVHMGDVAVPMTPDKAKKGGAAGNARPEVSALSIDTAPFASINGFAAGVELDNTAVIGNRRLLAAWASDAPGGGVVDPMSVPLAIQRVVPGVAGPSAGGSSSATGRPRDAKPAARPPPLAVSPPAPAATPAAAVGRALAAPQKKEEAPPPVPAAAAAPAPPATKKAKGTAAIGETPAVKATVHIRSGAPINAAQLNAATTCPAAAPTGGFAQAAVDAAP